MSFNFGGFGGMFGLDTSKFNFSAYTPKEEVKSEDPLDIVNPERVDAGITVAPENPMDVVTAPAPEPVVRYSSVVNDLISQPTPTVQNEITEQPAPTPEPVVSTPEPVIPEQPTSGIDLGMDFGIAPIEIAAAPSQDILSGTTSDPYTVSQQALDRNQSNYETSLDILADITSGIDNFGLSSVKRNDSISQEQADSIFDFVSGDAFASTVSDYSAAMEGQDKQGLYEDSRAVLSSLGVPNSFRVQGEFGGYKEYEFDTDKGEFYVVADNTLSKDAMMLETAIKAAPVVIATAGVGSALSSSATITGVAGGNTAVASALGHAAASGISTAIQGGDAGDILTSAALGGLGGYAKGLDALTTDAEYMLGLSTTEAASLTAHAELVNQVKTGVDLVQAVEADDVLGAVNAGLDLVGTKTLNDYVTNTILDSVDNDFITTNVDYVAAASIGAAEAIVKGEDAKEVIQNAVNTTIKDVVLTEENVGSVLNDVAGDNEFVQTNFEPIVKAVIEGGTKAADGGNSKDIFVSTVKEYIQEDGQILPTVEEGSFDFPSVDFGIDLDFLPDTDLKAVEDAYHEYVEDPLEQVWQAIEPEREAIETVVQTAVDTVDKKVVKPVTETVQTIVKEADNVVRELPTTKEDWQELEADTKEAASTANQFVQRDVIDPVQEGASQANQFVQRDVIDPIEEAIASIDTPSVPDTPSLPDVDNPISVDVEAGIDSRLQDFYYDDSGLVGRRGQKLSPQLLDLIGGLTAEQQETVKAKVLADEQERIKRTKNVYSPYVNTEVKYNA